MYVRWLCTIGALILLVAMGCLSVRNSPVPARAAVVVAQSERAILRDIPISNTIRRALIAGTRDSTGRPTTRYWQQWVDYKINASLDVPSSTISGRETVVFHNNSNSALRSIVLRLDQNIFTPGAARLQPLPRQLEITEGMKLTRLVVNGQTVDPNPPPQERGADPAAAGPMAFGLDQTVALIGLQHPIVAKGSATLEIDWHFKVPLVGGSRGIRMGRLADTVYQVAQWYPRIAMYDDLRGWDTEPYLGTAEFYNNFGKWDVSLEVPAGWIVGATGVLQNPDSVLGSIARERLSHVLESDEQRTIVGPGEAGTGNATALGKRLVWRFVADTANDFAWATSQSYVWDVTRATIPGRTAIPVHVLYLPRDTAFRHAGSIVRHSLEFYSRLWMPYPFPQLTLADGPERGMEYPMFIMSDVQAADHETGHQWWPMTVGVNETWYGWMDEGFNQYMNILSNSDRSKQPANLDGWGQRYGAVSGTEEESPMMWPANSQRRYYSLTTYEKSPMMLSMLGGLVGDTSVQRAMSEYARAWRFKHPSPWDYIFFMSNALGRDLGWFWNYWLFTTEAVNGSIQTVTFNKLRVAVTVRENGQMPSPVVLRVRFSPQGPAIRAMPNSSMADSITAIVRYPVDVWFNGNRTFIATLDFGSRRIIQITLDPFRRFPDRDTTDNVWPRAP